MRSIPRCGVPSVPLLQSLGQRVDPLRNDHQSKNQTLAIGSENELPSISVLRDVMPNIER